MTERCKSCDHSTQVHADDGSGCLFEIKSVRVCSDRICPCTFDAYRPPQCQAEEGVTGIRCERPAGHEEEHLGRHIPKSTGCDSVGYAMAVRWPLPEGDFR